MSNVKMAVVLTTIIVGLGVGAAIDAAGAQPVRGRPQPSYLPRCVGVATNIQGWPPRQRTIARVRNRCPFPVRVRTMWRPGGPGRCERLWSGRTYVESRWGRRQVWAMGC